METNVDCLKRDNKFKKLCKSKRNIESKLNYWLWNNPKRHFINHDNDFFSGTLLLLAPDSRLTFLATVVSEVRNCRTEIYFGYSSTFQTVNTT